MLLEALDRLSLAWSDVGTKPSDICLTCQLELAPLFLPFDQAFAHVLLTGSRQMLGSLLQTLAAALPIARLGTQLFHFRFTPETSDLRSARIQCLRR